MRIKEVESRTGLTAKAIRLYESKGLLKPARETENDYRDYTEAPCAISRTPQNWWKPEGKFKKGASDSMSLT